MNTESEEATAWSLYLVRTAEGSLYTGVTTDVQRRFSEHENKDKKNKGAKALRGRGPLTLVFTTVVGNRSDALKLEYRVKQLSRADKQRLISGTADLEELKAWLQEK
ncbi:MAG: GIY-YIG nuclease family protein [Gammaproteobacteria bacterium]|nr:GIY-YIG nuclease family protein [Gammaproteobacteria bacterium]MBL4728019.1 GIY-YIG nuclease family protein [Gammaproteobacteria bacterium]